MSTSPPVIACWVDPSIGEAGAHLALKKRFEGVSNRITQWHYFDNGDPLRGLFDANPNAALVVIMSGQLAHQHVSTISHLSNLHSVYVFCGNKQKYQSLPQEEPKVRGIFTSEDDLFQQMSTHLQRDFP
ncbi:unnamed protein product [Adineta ricciae]|uniref:Uncharacterized protein n=1 Tax=Adineta ricciae TaxID=249248 RepID=A0A815BKG6_ADIRI|nr:unnamed protein product [Adineta ricciae]CAF1271562.1 unnamed protein product [Adineta ricciae]